MRQQDPAAAPPATLVWLYNLLSSHDFVARGEDDLAWTDEMCHLRRRFGRVHGCRDLRSTWLYAAFFASSFTYSFIGLAMLLFFNRRLPRRLCLLEQLSEAFQFELGPVNLVPLAFVPLDNALGCCCCCACAAVHG